jgi:2,3-diketo-5-methylthio-1-phosphopentane phosphatase
VRRHGMYVWGKTWEEAKRHGECLHYLFEIAISMKKLGMDFQSAPAPLISIAPSVENGSKKRNRESSSAAVSELAGVKYVLFDIEGTTTPISFVKDVLFPYSAKNFKTFLEENWGDAETMEDLKLLQVDYEAEKGPFVPDAATCASFLSLCVAEDRKCSYLKNIQGRIWDKGYSSGSLKSEVYLDIMHFFMRANARNIKIAIYSSGSRKAQKLLFKYSNLGDLRDHISCYFDTSVGLKQQPSSYTDIVKSLGVDNASEIMFITDILAEGQAAVSAGMRSMLAVRPGNAALPTKHGFTTVSNFDELLL